MTRYQYRLLQYCRGMEGRSQLGWYVSDQEFYCTYAGDNDDLREILNEYGADGWEMADSHARLTPGGPDGPMFYAFVFRRAY